MVPIYDHVEFRNSDYPDGVYRVVGTTDDTVTLLHVAAADGRRIHTGRTVSVSHDTYAALPSASNPDESGSPLAVVRSLPTVAYWGIRAYGQQWASRPVPAAVAGSVAVVGVISPPGLPVSPLGWDILLGVGIAGLVAIGYRAGQNNDAQ